MAVQTEALMTTTVTNRRPGPSRLAARAVAAAPLVAVLFLLPLKSDTFGHVAAYAAIFVMVGLSMNVLTGYTGQISLGHQAFVGLGALTAANVVSTGVTPADPFTFAIGMLTAAAAAGAAALLLGAVALRIRGLYLALVTLVFGSVFADAIFTLPSLNGHEAGVSAYRPTFISSEYRYYLFALAMVAICYYIDVRVRKSKVGRGLVALRDNELVAAAFGVDVLRYKLLGFTISGAMAGLAGGVFAFWSQEFSDKDFTAIAGFNLALTFVVVVVVGGLANRGGVMGAGAFFALVSPISPLLQWVADKTHWGTYYGNNKFYIANVIGAVLLLQTVILNPGGLGQVIRPFARWFAGHPFTLHDPDGDAGVGAMEGSSVRA
ncbi:MAG: branched-chain amino acid transport system permease protein [Frankiaceae bacterium]|jgi:branched-chain amino acid transport system permease protein|nr:branched-chain amino acid transport system permease protein [Frankiaceae bacterium]